MQQVSASQIQSVRVRNRVHICGGSKGLLHAVWIQEGGSPEPATSAFLPVSRYKQIRRAGPRLLCGGREYESRMRIGKCRDGCRRGAGFEVEVVDEEEVFNVRDRRLFQCLALFRWPSRLFRGRHRASLYPPLAQNAKSHSDEPSAPRST